MCLASDPRSCFALVIIRRIITCTPDTCIPNHSRNLTNVCIVQMCMLWEDGRTAATDIAHTTVKYFLAVGALQADAVKTSHREDIVWKCVWVVVDSYTNMCMCTYACECTRVWGQMQRMLPFTASLIPTPLGQQCKYDASPKEITICIVALKAHTLWISSLFTKQG